MKRIKKRKPKDKPEYFLVSTQNQTDYKVYQRGFKTRIQAEEFIQKLPEDRQFEIWNKTKSLKFFTSKWFNFIDFS